MKSNSKPDQKLLELQKEINDLKLENAKMRDVLEEHEIQGFVKDISDVEAICILQIELLLETAKTREFLADEVKNLESLNKTLKSARGEDFGKRKKKKKAKDPAKLLKILENEK